MGQIVGGNTNLEFYKQLETINNELETINNELDDINTTLASHTSSISALNSRTEELDSRMDSQETETDNLLARLSGQRTLTTLQELFNSCPNGLSFFISSAGSVDVPAQNTAWLYGSGIVLKRNTSDAVVVLYAYNSPQFAINSTVNGGATWLGWQIKS